MKQTAEEWLKEQITGCKIFMDIKEYPRFIHYYKNDKLIFYQDIKNDEFCLIYDNICSFLETKYKINHQQIRDLTKIILEKHFKYNVSYISMSIV